MNIQLIGNSNWGNPLTEIQVKEFKSKSIYSNYEVGDEIGYILIQNKDIRDGSSIALYLKSIVKRDVERFLSEYELVEGYKDRYIRIDRADKISSF